MYAWKYFSFFIIFIYLLENRSEGRKMTTLMMMKKKKRKAIKKLDFLNLFICLNLNFFIKVPKEWEGGCGKGGYKINIRRE